MATYDSDNVTYDSDNYLFEMSISTFLNKRKEDFKSIWVSNLGF